MHRVVMVLCAALLLAQVIVKSRTGQELPAHAAFRVLSSGRVTVKVDGDVRHRGIYEFTAKNLAQDAIKMADPLRPVNLSLTDSAVAGLSLQNGTAVTLELLPDGSHHLAVTDIGVAERMVLGIPLDISTMSEVDFDRLPGVGPALAKRITEYRQKNGGILREEDLIMIEGIGEKKYHMILSFIQPSKNKQ
jgi:competence protein ComEA